MKKWLLRIAVVLSALAVLLTGTWWAWRKWYSADQFREAVRKGFSIGDFSRAERLMKLGADTGPWRELDAYEQFIEAIADRDSQRVEHLLEFRSQTVSEYDYGFLPRKVLVKIKGDEDFLYGTGVIVVSEDEVRNCDGFFETRPS